MPRPLDPPDADGGYRYYYKGFTLTLLPKGADLWEGTFPLPTGGHFQPPWSTYDQVYESLCAGLDRYYRENPPQPEA